MRYFTCSALLAGAFYLLHFLLGGTRTAFSLAALICVSAAALLPTLRRWEFRPRVDLLCLISTGVLSVYVAVRSLLSPVEFLARPDQLLLVNSLTVYLVVVFCLTSPAHRVGFAFAMLLLGLVHLGVALLQLGTAQDVSWLGFLRQHHVGRISGLFISPNHFAGFLELVIVTGASLAWWCRWKPWVRIMVGYSTGAMAIGVLLSGSRGGYLSAGFALIVFVILTGYALRAVRRRFAMLIGALVAIGALVFVLAPIIMLNPILKAQVEHRFGLLGERDIRLELGQAAMQQAALNPVFGTGSGTYYYFGRKFRAPIVQTDPVRVHNDYLEMYAEYGAVGLACIFLFIGAHLRRGLSEFRRWIDTAGRQSGEEPGNKIRKKSVDRHSQSFAMTIAALCAVSAYLVHSLFDFNLHIPANAMLMAFFFGILANPCIQSRFKLAEISTVRRILPWSAPAMAIVGGYLVFSRLPVENLAEKARTTMRDKKYGETLAAASAGVQRDPQHADMFYLLGQAARKLARTEKDEDKRRHYIDTAIDAYRMGLKAFPQDIRLLLILGWTLDWDNRQPESTAVFQQALAWDPNSGPVHAYYGWHMELVGDLVEAKRAYLRATQLGDSGDGSVQSAVEGLQRLSEISTEPPAPAK